MTIKLNDIDIRILESLADDYYGLWEVCDYFVQLMPERSAAAVRQRCKARVQQYVKEGLVDVFVGTMTKNDFRKIAPKDVQAILNRKSSWATPRDVRQVVAICGTDKAEKAVAAYPMK